MAPLTEPAVRARISSAHSRPFTRYAWAVLAWNLVVVLWGAYVRASGSGAGCGSHWPLCNGEIVPRAPRIATLIEFTHRATSGLAFIAVALLVIWSFRAFTSGHRVRRFATLSAVFFVLEALLGAGLVLFQYVAKDASAGRAISLCLHLLNTQLLLAALALTAWFSSHDAIDEPAHRAPLLIATLPITLLVSIAGVIAALGDTLYPAASLGAGMRQDVSATASFLLRLRVLHPALAIAGAAFIVFAAMRTMRSSPTPITMRAGLFTILLTAAQLGAGAINLALLAPVWLQIVHLLLADFVWLALVLLNIAQYSAGPTRSLVRARIPANCV